jgi:hypothetical protein
MPQPPVQLWRDAILAADIDATAKLVALVLACYATAEGRARPSRAAIAAGASLDVRTVERAVHRLEHAGLLAVTRAGRGAGQAVTNRYRGVVPNSGTVPLFPVEPYERIAALSTSNSGAVPPELERELEEPRARDTAELASAARRAFMARLEARA